MKIIVFTKLLKPWGADQLIAFAQKTGIAGYDLTVRDGYPVEPASAGTKLLPFVKQLQAAGLSVPLATIGSRALAPREKATEAAWAACAEAGIAAVKLGYWVWEPGGPHYWDRVTEIKRELEAYAELAGKYGVQAVLHTHSNTYYGLNASALMHLISGFDPARIGAYLDPAHLAIDGEPLPMALDILKSRLALVAVKNSHYRRTQDGGTTVWKSGVCPLHEGLVDWRQAVRELKQAGYAGPLSVHGEYDGRHDTESVLPLLEPDIAYLKGILSAR